MHLDPSRRQLRAALAATGVGTAAFQRAVVAQASPNGADRGVTAEMIQQAEWVCGLTLADADRKALVGRVNGLLRGFAALRKVDLPNDVPPAFAFVPTTAGPAPTPLPAAPARLPLEIARPANDTDLAFLSVAELGSLLRARKVSSVELTKLSLARLRKFDPVLKCVVTLTEDLALKQAKRADDELAAGKYRGPLHGVPWGAKDLIAVPGYPTTWGAPQFKDRVLNETAAVAKKLDDAGAVLVAKLSLGALAMGDRWFGGMTRSPWDPDQGSSGSSAGSAAAVAAGLVPFAVGSETYGSIVSPCTRCGATGLRPTFGRVARTGCMTLTWSMDKLGPIARTVDDCGTVLAAIHGADGKDAAAVDRPFRWPHGRGVKGLRVGYTGDAHGRPELDVLRSLGATLVPVKLPESPPVGPLLSILTAEAAAAFDELTRAGVTEGLNAWPHLFRSGQFVPAVEYIRANRVRTLLMRAMDDVLAGVDLTVGGDDLLLTNLTGHPTAVLPNGFAKAGGAEAPTALTFTGRLYGEAELLAVADAYQRATGHHRRRPPVGGA